MDDLAAGIMLLPERSSLRLTERQAAKIREIYLLVQAGFRRESFIRLKMSDILTKEQMAFIKKRADEMDPVQFHYAIEVDHAVIRDLRALAGADGSEKPAVVPDSFRPEDVAPHFAFNPVFISNFQEMQRSFPVRMTREQARQALPYVLLYYVNIPAERPPYQILKVLTDEQKDFIDTCHDRIARRGTSHLELIRSFKEFLDARAGAP